MEVGAVRHLLKKSDSVIPLACPRKQMNSILSLLWKQTGVRDAKGRLARLVLRSGFPLLVSPTSSRLASYLLPSEISLGL